MKKLKSISKIKFLSLFYIILAYSLVVLSGTYAFQALNASDSITTEQAGCFQVNYTGQNLTSSDISTTDIYSEGARATVTLSKASSCKIYTEANIYLKTNNTTTAPITTVQALKYKVFSGAYQISEGTVTSLNDYLLATVPLTDTSTVYTIYLWIDNVISAGYYTDTSYSGYIYANSTQTSTIEGNYLVNFDLNNGSNLGLSKTVTNGSTYGWLPTPSKTGYTFDGWSNSVFPDGDLINSTKWAGNQNVTVTKTNDYTQVIYNQSNSTPGYIYRHANEWFEVGKTYTITAYVKGVNTTSFTMGVYGNTNLTFSNVSTSEFRKVSKTFTFANNNQDYILLYGGTGVGNGFQFKWIKFQEGSSAATDPDSYYITSNTTVSQTANQTLSASWSTASYTVRFNANGGNVSPSSMTVTYGGTYSGLPTPTRGGSTFLGWHGKNLINIPDMTEVVTSAYYKDRSSDPPFIFTEGTNYTLSFNYTVNSSSYSVYSSVGYGINSFQRDIKNSAAYSGTGKVVVSFTTPNSFNFTPPYAWFRLVRMSSVGNANVDISNIQLEYGDTATAFEPYYITDSTTVTRDSDHILYAMWG